MKYFLILSVLLLPFLLTGLHNEEKPTIKVFYKEREPSQKVLNRVNELLDRFRESYHIVYYNIDDKYNEDLIGELGLPDTHFPFAIAINGKYTANIDGKTVSFVHFPLFMHGIGRHEGNWSLSDVKKVLRDNSLLSENNILPVLDKEKETTSCDE